MRAIFLLICCEKNFAASCVLRDAAEFKLDVLEFKFGGPEFLTRCGVVFLPCTAWSLPCTAWFLVRAKILQTCGGILQIRYVKHAK